MNRESIMSKAYLKTLYARIYHEDFSYSEFEKRMKMQKAIYLLQEMGAPIGDYSFFWYKHGPYSQDLQDTMYAIKNVSDENTAEFSADMEKDITRVGKALAETGVYSQSQWAECMASVYYLLKNIFQVGTADEKICEELRNRKPYLDNDSENERALKLVKELCA